MLRNAYGTFTYPPTKLLVPLLEHHSIANNSALIFFQIAEIQTPRSRNTYPMHPSTSYGAVPETLPEIPKILATDTIRITY